MEEESFTYATLRKIERAENTSPRLQRLEPRFWERLGEHLTKLRQAFQDQQEEDPTSRRTVVLADELRNTQRLAESIWGFREKKVVQSALAATRKREATTGPPEHTTQEERHLFTEVCAVLQRSRDETAITDPFSRRRRTERREAAEAAADAARTPPVPSQAGSQTATHTTPQPQHGTAGTPGQGPAPVPVSASPAGPGGPGGGESHDVREVERAPGRPGGSPGAPTGEEEGQAPLQGRGGMGAAGEPEVELRVVQALADVPLFTGIDLVDYELAKGEIGNLPKNAAESLSTRGMVRILPA